MWKTKIKTALVQMAASDRKDDNIRRAVSLVEKAAVQGAAVVVLPECFTFRGKAALKEIRNDIAESLDGQTVKAFQALAKKLKIFLLLGSIYERVPGESRAYNTAVFLGPDGKRKAFYRKRNLFEARIGATTIRERDIFLPGKKYTTIDFQGAKAGIGICYDVRFPEVFRIYSKRKCDIIILPSNFTYETGKSHWEILLRARAIENRCYVLAPNQCGKDNKGVRAYGNSMIIDPWGRVVARASTTKQEIIFATLDQQVVLETRNKFEYRNSKEARSIKSKD
jgi:predicted amidohydrolase